MTPPDTSKRDKQNKSFSLLWQLWGLGPQRHLLFSYGERRGQETTPGISKTAFWKVSFFFFFLLLVGLARAFSLTVHASSLFLLSRFATSAFLEGRLLIDWKTWYVEEAPATETLRLRGSLMWMRTSVLIQSWRSLWIMNELARLTWFPRRLFALHSQVWRGGKTHTLWNASKDTWPEVCRHYWTFFVITFNTDYEVYDQHLLALNFKKISSAADLIGLSIPICTRMFWSKPLCGYILSAGMRLFLETKLQTNLIKAAV